MNAARSFSIRLCRILLGPAWAGAGLLVLSGTSGLADWPDNNTNVAKWYQFPDRSTNGYDILAGAQPPGPAATQPLILADDFRCTRSGPITDIHLWASWLGLVNPTNVPPIPITLGIWTDIPAGTNADGSLKPSHPGSLMWSQLFNPGQYTYRPVASVPGGETFWNPDPAPVGLVLGPDYVIWQYNFYPTNPFVQEVGTIYWLSVTAGFPGQTGTSEPLFGWKTTATNHFGDDAVFGHVDPTGTALGDWKDLVDPRTLGTAYTQSLDLSFVLTTPEIVTNPPPPPPPPVKWIQYPNLLGGFDVDATLPHVVADDFLCTNVSTITNIQIWSSFFQDQQDTNLTFVLAFWSDALPTFAAGYSHPGTLLWTETFAPGSYTSSNYARGDEFFYVPDTGQVTPETQAYLYSFTPRRPFCQQGSLQSPRVYWLSVYALPGTAGSTLQIGWKTSTNHFRDDAVWDVLGSGGYTGNWKELFSPIATPQISLDLAFVLKNGPPTPDCDRSVRPKWIQLPDTSTNGLDVLATAPEIVGDDFVCRASGPISGVTIWGSWLNDLVDTNASFVLRLWTDVPAQPGTTGFSHPGDLLCETKFYAPQAVGTSLQRYNYSLAASGVQETFYNPDVPGPAGFMGNDTQIWRYDFYPFQPGCWAQRGTPFGAGLTYWVTIDYLPVTGSQYLFGAKTAKTHLLDDAVYGHLNANNFPLGDWLDLRDPRTNQSLDLAHALWNFPVRGINKDLVNNTTAVATAIQIVVAGHHVITWHYDGTPPWPVFQVSYVGGNTVLQWSGLALPPGGPTHVGFEMASSSNPVILSMNWLSGGALLQPPAKQANFHWLNNGTILVVVNNIAQAQLVLAGGIVEWHAAPVPLDQMTANGQRNPLATAPLQLPPNPILPGGAALIPVPPAPKGAMYELILVGLTDPVGGGGSMDYLLVPLDAAQQPQIDSVNMMGGNVNLMWSAIPGRLYRIQSKMDLADPNWMDSGMGDIMAMMPDMNVMLPFTGARGFFRLYLVPE